MRRLAGNEGPVWGEALGRELGITRAAVARHVAALRRQGFTIAASTRTGYRLVGAPDTLSAAHVLPALGTRRLGRRWLHLPSCRSTNDVAAEAGRAGQPEGLVVVAEEQTAGRGRLGRTWHAAPAESLTLSVLLRPPVPPADVPPLTLVAGVAVARAAQELGCAGRLKWPNDLLLDTPEGPRKAAGILTEMASDMERVAHVVIGIGLNVNQRALPPDIAARATSLRLVLGRPLDRRTVLAAVLYRLEEAYDRFLAEGPAAAAAMFRPWAALPRRCRVADGAGDAVEGLAEDVADDGALLLRDDAGRLHHVVSGELV